MVVIFFGSLCRFPNQRIIIQQYANSFIVVSEY